MMTVGELLNYLESADPESEVRIASQPSWPFEYKITNVIDSRTLWHDYQENEDDGEVRVDEPDEVIYLFEGYQIGYLPSYARDRFEA